MFIETFHLSQFHYVQEIWNNIFFCLFRNQFTSQIAPILTWNLMLRVTGLTACDFLPGDNELNSGSAFQGRDTEGSQNQWHLEALHTAQCCLFTGILLHLGPCPFKQEHVFPISSLDKDGVYEHGISSMGFVGLRLKAFCCLTNSQWHFIFNIIYIPRLDSSPFNDFNLQRQA